MRMILIVGGVNSVFLEGIFCLGQKPNDSETISSPTDKVLMPSAFGMMIENQRIVLERQNCTSRECVINLNGNGPRDRPRS